MIAIPTVREFMTPQPVTISPEASFEKAHELMREHRIRHLPVVRGEKLLGVLSLRDLHLVETLPGVEPAEVCVEEGMSRDVFAVTMDAPLDWVTATMAQQTIGSAVVLEGGSVLGIFTEVDACRALSAVLNNREHAMA